MHSRRPILILFLISVLGQGSTSVQNPIRVDCFTEVAALSRSSAWETVLERNLTGFEREYLKSRLQKRGPTSGENVAGSLAYLHGLPDSNRAESGLKSFVDLELYDSARQSGPPLRKVAPPLASHEVPSHSTQTRTLAEDPLLSDWTSYIGRRVGALESFIVGYRPGVEVSGLSSTDSLAVLAKQGFTQINKVEVFNVVYGREAYVLKNPRTGEYKLLFTGFQGNYVLEHTQKQVQLLLRKNGLPTDVLVRLPDSGKVAASQELKAQGQKFASEIPGEDASLIIGYRKNFQDELKKNGHELKGERFYGDFKVYEYSVSGKPVYLVEAKNAYYGDVLDNFIGPVLRSQKVGRMIYAGSAGAIDESLPPYAVTRSNQFRQHDGTLTTTQPVVPVALSPRVKPVVHGNSMTPLEQNMGYIQDLKKGNVGALDCEASLLAKSAQMHGVPFEFFGIVTDYPGNPRQIDIDREIKPVKDQSKKLLVESVFGWASGQKKSNLSPVTTDTVELFSGKGLQPFGPSFVDKGGPDLEKAARHFDVSKPITESRGLKDYLQTEITPDNFKRIEEMAKENPKQKFIWVLTMDGKLKIAPSYLDARKKDFPKHYEMAEGKKLLASGELRFSEDGRPELDFVSGTYMRFLSWEEQDSYVPKVQRVFLLRTGIKPVMNVEPYRGP